MAKRRTSEVELCFDSMTDLITNLAGGLILLVLLLLGVTREAKSQPSDQPTSGKKGKEDAGTRPIGNLETRIAALRGAIAQANKEFSTLESRMPKLKQEVEELVKKVGAVTPPKPAEAAPEDKEKEPTPVQYRLPLERLVSKGGLAFLLEEGRVSFVDYEAMSNALSKAIDGKGPAELANLPIKLELPGSDFRVEGFYKHDGKRGGFRGQLLRKRDAQGETLEQIKRPDSRFQTLLKKHSPAKYLIELNVYPDSYDVFRDVRQLVWKGDYEVGWMPQEPGKPMELATGIGGAPRPGQ